MSKIEKEIRDLEDKIRYHQHLYYVKNKPEISDKEFDLLFKKLQKLEAENPELASPNSPTQIVGSDLDNEFEKVTHKIPVLSLENTYNINELTEWITKTDTEGEYSVEWKIDGASIVLYYEKGKLDKAVTRGTGGIGDDVTANIRTIKNIPLILKDPVTIYVRGEVHMGFKDFEEFNEESGGKYANPRNLAAGSIKHKNSSQTAKRPLKILTYDGYFPEGYGKIKTHAEMLKFMKNQNLPVSEDSIIVKAKDVIKKVEEFKKKKDNLDFPTDGLVIKLNSLAKRDQLGATQHSPRWARAYKFDALMKESTILKIDFAVGRTGKITPRAEIEPVQLAGTTVKFATLHNQDYIDELGIGIGAKVLVAKRGEIIPAVEEVIEKGPSGIFKLPSKCPCCGTKLGKVDDSVDLFCPNKKCPDREKNNLIFFCQKKQMDIEGLGEKQIQN
ncbi:MAG TPA: NAD-dependent DNA ligase LigA, partial [Leptospiraceae bacterium]|nr:NAD-dependent DNA ligase LigA [Leptospiraceae bacterium]